MTPEEKKARIAEFMKTREIIESGYAGILSNGNIVDRRLNPEAQVMLENESLGIPAPKKI